MLSACILIEAHLSFLDVGVLVCGSDHFADTSGWLVVELGAKLTMVESSDKGGDDLSFRDVGNIIPHLGETSNVVAKELGRLLVDAVEIMLGARPSTRSHIIVGEDFFSSSQDPMESRARLVNELMAGGMSMMGR